MKCAVHPELDATGFCRNCGKPMCPACTRPVRDVLYCEDCLAKITGLAGAAPADAPGWTAAAPGGHPPPADAPRTANNPGLAFVLGFLFPGIGAVYNGEYNKALVQILIFASFIFGLASDLDDAVKAVLGILLGGFVFYMAFDAARVAKAHATGETVTDPLGTMSKDRNIGPIVLIAIGALLLLHNFDFFPFFQLHRFWPLIVIAVGVLMFRNRIGNRS
jgi:TM2 domain-containing membrane protein YozV